MAEARCRERWTHTAALLALLANAHRDPKKSRPYKPADFNPYERVSQRLTGPRATVNVGVLKQVFVDQPVVR